MQHLHDSMVMPRRWQTTSDRHAKRAQKLFRRGVSRAVGGGGEGPGGVCRDFGGGGGKIFFGGSKLTPRTIWGILVFSEITVSVS